MNIPILLFYGNQSQLTQLKFSTKTSQIPKILGLEVLFLINFVFKKPSFLSSQNWNIINKVKIIYVIIHKPVNTLKKIPSASEMIKQKCKVIKE
jgi:hypothetical protein